MTDPNTPAVANFNFQRLHVENSTAEMPLPWVAPEAKLVVRPAIEANKRFQSAMLALAGKRTRRLALGGTPTPDDARADRDDDRKLYPRHIIVDWDGITDTEGNPVPCTEQNAYALMKALPNWIVDKIRIFCMRPESFVESEDELPPDPVELAGN